MEIYLHWHSLAMLSGRRHSYFSSCIIGGIYTGLSDGRIIRVDKELKSFSTIIRTGVDSDQCGKGKEWSLKSPEGG